METKQPGAAHAPRLKTCAGPSRDGSVPCPDNAQLGQLSNGEGATRCVRCGAEAFRGIKLQRENVCSTDEIVQALGATRAKFYLCRALAVGSERPLALRELSARELAECAREQGITQITVGAT